MMTRIEQSIEVNVPATTVYNQLTQFEDYPRFMEDIEEVRQLDDTHLHWRAKLNSHDMEWDAEIMEQVPDRVIAWRNMGGPVRVEKVEVHPLDQEKSKVTMFMEYEEPQQQAQGQESDIDIKIAEHAVHDLMRFKKFIESRRSETGAWRGEVREGKELKPGGNGAQQQPSGQQGSQQAGAQQQPAGRPGGQQAEGQQSPSQQAEGQQSPSQQAAGQPASQQQPGDQQVAVERSPEQQPSAQPAAAQQARAQAGQQPAGQMSTPQQQGLQGAQQDPMLAAMTSMNPQSWLPNILHAWEEPFVIMRKMTEDMDQIFERFVGRPMYGAKPRQQAEMPAGGTWSPPLEVAQRDNQLLVRAELPGVKQEDVHVEIKNDRLVIEGDRREEQQSEGKEFRRTERNYGHFYRAIALPDGINPEQASASMRDGVLEVVVPVQQTRQQGRQLDIRSSS
jgi:HSP20 family molecular chaperone IbpA/ribosome-associated toxin RatA of RatAB toxin-antitoxin module